MKEHFYHRINYNEVGADLTLRLEALFGLLQYAAVTHSENVGAGTKVLLEQNYTWVLGKIRVAIGRLPLLGEDIVIKTWSLGATGFTAVRDFEIDGVCRATSIWYFIDVKRKRPVKVPEEIILRYNSLKIPPFFYELKNQKFSFESDNFFSEKIDLRYSDFDSNKHVNNTVYFNLLQTALFRKYGHVPFLSDISCQFLNEILADAKDVYADVSDNNQKGNFRIRSQKEFCAGVFSKN